MVRRTKKRDDTQERDREGDAEEGGLPEEIDMLLRTTHRMPYLYRSLSAKEPYN